MPRTYDKDPYQILGISSTATTAQVKQAYRKLARQYHPDLNKDPRAIERMKDINWANSILSDTQERSLYDYWQASRFQRPYSPGTNHPHPNATPRYGSTSPNPPPNRPYEYVRTTQHTSQSQGYSAATTIVIIIIIISNALRTLRPISQPTSNFSPQFFVTQTAMAQRLDSAIGTLHAAHELGTKSPSLYEILVTPTPTAELILRDELGHDDLRPEIVPGTQVWEWINLYFPELTTPDGLSDEVTSIVYIQLRGYLIKTRNSGEYWIHDNRYTHIITTEHIPPTQWVTPNP